MAQNVETAQKYMKFRLQNDVVGCMSLVSGDVLLVTGDGPMAKGADALRAYLTDTPLAGSWEAARFERGQVVVPGKVKGCPNVATIIFDFDQYGKILQLTTNFSSPDPATSSGARGSAGARSSLNKLMGTLSRSSGDKPVMPQGASNVPAEVASRVEVAQKYMNHRLRNDTVGCMSLVNGDVLLQTADGPTTKGADALRTYLDTYPLAGSWETARYDSKKGQVFVPGTVKGGPPVAMIVFDFDQHGKISQLTTNFSATASNARGSDSARRSLEKILSGARSSGGRRASIPAGDSNVPEEVGPRVEVAQKYMNHRLRNDTVGCMSLVNGDVLLQTADRPTAKGADALRTYLDTYPLAGSWETARYDSKKGQVFVPGTVKGGPPVAMIVFDFDQHGKISQLTTNFSAGIDSAAAAARTSDGAGARRSLEKILSGARSSGGRRASIPAGDSNVPEEVGPRVEVAQKYMNHRLRNDTVGCMSLVNGDVLLQTADGPTAKGADALRTYLDTYPLAGSWETARYDSKKGQVFVPGTVKGGPPVAMIVFNFDQHGKISQLTTNFSAGIDSAAAAARGSAGAGARRSFDKLVNTMSLGAGGRRASLPFTEETVPPQFAAQVAVAQKYMTYRLTNDTIGCMAHVSDDVLLEMADGQYSRGRDALRAYVETNPLAGSWETVRYENGKVYVPGKLKEGPAHGPATIVFEFDEHGKINHLKTNWNAPVPAPPAAVPPAGAEGGISGPRASITQFVQSVTSAAGVGGRRSSLAPQVETSGEVPAEVAARVGVAQKYMTYRLANDTTGCMSLLSPDVTLENADGVLVSGADAYRKYLETSPLAGAWETVKYDSKSGRIYAPGKVKDGPPEATIIFGFDEHGKILKLTTNWNPPTISSREQRLSSITELVRNVTASGGGRTSLPAHSEIPTNVPPEFAPRVSVAQKYMTYRLANDTTGCMSLLSPDVTLENADGVLISGADAYRKYLDTTPLAGAWETVKYDEQGGGRVFAPGKVKDGPPQATIVFGFDEHGKILKMVTNWNPPAISSREQRHSSVTALVNTVTSGGRTGLPVYPEVPANVPPEFAPKVGVAQKYMAYRLANDTTGCMSLLSPDVTLENPDGVLLSGADALRTYLDTTLLAGAWETVRYDEQGGGRVFAPGKLKDGPPQATIIFGFDEYGKILKLTTNWNAPAISSREQRRSSVTALVNNVIAGARTSDGIPRRASGSGPERGSGATGSIRETPQTAGNVSVAQKYMTCRLNNDRTGLLSLVSDDVILETTKDGVILQNKDDFKTYIENNPLNGTWETARYDSNLGRVVVPGKIWNSDSTIAFDFNEHGKITRILTTSNVVPQSVAANGRRASFSKLANTLTGGLWSAGNANKIPESTGSGLPESAAATQK